MTPLTSKIAMAFGLTLSVAACSDTGMTQNYLLQSDNAGTGEIRWHWVDCDSIYATDLDKNGGRCYRPFTVDAQ